MEEKRHYFDMESELRHQIGFLRAFLVLTVLLSGLSMFVAWSSWNRPPLVVKVDAQGQSVATEAFSQGPSDEEKQFFAKKFLRIFLAPQPEAVDYDMAEALSLMAEELRKGAEEEAKKFARKIYEDGIRTRVVWKKVEPLPENRNRIRVEADFISTDRYGVSRTDTRRFVVDLVEVKRTKQNPWGLMVYGLSRD